MRSPLASACPRLVVVGLALAGAVAMPAALAGAGAGELPACPSRLGACTSPGAWTMASATCSGGGEGSYALVLRGGKADLHGGAGCRNLYTRTVAYFDMSLAPGPDGTWVSETGLARLLLEADCTLRSFADRNDFGGFMETFDAGAPPLAAGCPRQASP